MRQPQVVFIDDERRFLESLELGLRHLRREWPMRFFDDPSRALSELDGHPSAVVVSDWLMPGLSGLDLARRLREGAPAGYRYVILVSGRTSVADTVSALEAGVDDYISKPFDMRELVARIRVGMRIVGLERRLRAANDELERLATTDPLTRLLNRRRGGEVLTHELERVGRGKQQLAVVLIDLDHFKRINDRYGHEAGDAVLVEVSRRLTAATRRYDALSRWGGEELLCVLPHTSLDEGGLVAERLRAAIAAPPVELGRGPEVTVTASLGVASVGPGSRCTAEELVARADGAMYRAKRGGRNRVETSGANDER